MKTSGTQGDPASEDKEGHKERQVSPKINLRDVPQGAQSSWRNAAFIFTIVTWPRSASAPRNCKN